MKKCLISFFVFSFSWASHAQLNATLIDALSGSQETVQTNENLTTTNDSELTQGEEMETSASCASEDQKSLPLSLVMGLLRGKGATLTPTHDPETGSLNIFGGPMIANCNSMLDFVFHPAGNKIPHSFETRVKSCGSEECEFEVHSMVGDEIKTEKKKFKPSMDGFIQCLKETGVYDDGAINKKRIVQANFDVDKSGITQSSGLVFVSKGPAFNNMKKIFSAKNLHKNNECYFYEDIQSGGFNIYSKADTKEQVLLDRANKLCSTGNYQEIYDNLESFTSIAGTYHQLESIMQKDLLNKMAKAKKEFDKAVKEGDLSKLDTQKYADLFEDFNQMIVQKHFNEDSHNDADKNNEELIVNLYKKLESAETEEEKEQIEKKIRDKTAELTKLIQKPYFSPGDYAHFISLKKKAPIKDPLWKKATLNMHKSVLSLKAGCQAYSVDNSGCNSLKGVKDLMPVEDLQTVIKGYTNVAQNQYEKREQVLKNPDENNSDFYADKLNDCQELYAKRSRTQQAWQQQQGQIYQSAVQQCQQKNQYANQYGGWYQNRLESCVEGQMEDAKSKYTVSSTSIEVCEKMTDTYKSKYKEWAKLEGYRDEYYGKEVSSKDISTPTVSSSASQDLPLRYTPPQVSNQYNPMASMSYTQYMNPMQQGQQQTYGYPSYNPNQYSMYPSQYSRYPSSIGSGINFNYGLGTGYSPYQQGYGLNYQAPGQMGYLQSPGVYQNFSTPSYFAPGSQGFGVSNNFNTGVGAGFNFTYR